MSHKGQPLMGEGSGQNNCFNHGQNKENRIKKIRGFTPLFFEGFEHGHILLLSSYGGT